MKKKLFTIIGSIIAVLVIAGAVFALTGTTALTSTGTIAVAAEGDSYELTTTELDFGTDNTAVPSTIDSVTATIDITNTGTNPITAFSVALTTAPVDGSGWTIEVSPNSGLSIETGGVQTLTFTLEGSMPSTPTTIDLSGVTCDLTPIS